MGRNMGMGKLGGSNVCVKRKFRWMFNIKGVVGDEGGSAEMLPPDKGARPSLSFKETEVQHLNEIIYFAGKPDWKPIQLTLFDIKTKKNPIFQWLKNQYDTCGEDRAVWVRPYGQWKKDVTLELYDGCGEVIEKWHIVNAWPNNVEWGDLDMSESGYVTVELTLRYDRAWIEGC